jgi:tRNA-dihydrouridine synthase A
MMDWTDRHCRAFHRALTGRALLYTEMVAADAVVHSVRRGAGARERLLAFSQIEHPVALQVGGAEPDSLRQAASIGAAFGYDEINLNVGCPSDRVQSGRFGACLMREPALVAALVSAMRDGAGRLPVTVKCRIGVDEQDPQESLFRLVETVAAAGCGTFIVHARKAWLQGLSPKENREIPPLDYAIVHRLKRARPDLEIILNGGLRDVAHGLREAEGLDGVMLGRAAYQTPAILLEVDPIVYGAAAPSRDAVDAVRRHLPYIENNLARGTPLHVMTKSMLGLFHGAPGGRVWRRCLSQEAHRAGAGTEVVLRALAQMHDARERVLS